jgi:hypothetical protein
MLYFVDVSFPERYSDFRTQICRFILIIVVTGVEWCAIVLVIALFILFFFFKVLRVNLGMICLIIVF